MASFPYKRVLLVGATSGIGAALADKLIKTGSKVIAVGRRQDRLDAFVQKHGAEHASSVTFDITDRARLDSFVNEIIDKYPDLDSVILNSGVQSVVRLNEPQHVDLEAFHREIDTNFTSVVNLSVKFLPHLLRKEYKTSLVLTGTHLSVVPAVTMPAYSASKAATRAYFDCLRRQNQGSNVTFMEISPPVVQTELHDYMGDHGRSLGMPVDQFIEEAYQGMAQNQEQIVVGVPGTATEEQYKQLLDTRQTIFDSLSNILMARF